MLLVTSEPAITAWEAVVAQDAVMAFVAQEEVGFPPPLFRAYEAVKADTAYDAVVAQEEDIEDDAQEEVAPPPPPFRA